MGNNESKGKKTGKAGTEKRKQARGRFERWHNLIVHIVLIAEAGLCDVCFVLFLLEYLRSRCPGSCTARRFGEDADEDDAADDDSIAEIDGGGVDVAGAAGIPRSARRRVASLARPGPGAQSARASVRRYTLPVLEPDDLRAALAKKREKSYPLTPLPLSHESLGGRTQVCFKRGALGRSVRSHCMAARASAAFAGGLCTKKKNTHRGWPLPW